MRLIQVFDPALCCSSGVCGAEVDQNLVTFAGDAEWIKQQGGSLYRFNLAQQPLVFAETPAVASFLELSGEEGLPMTLVDGQVQALGDGVGELPGQLGARVADVLFHDSSTQAEPSRAIRADEAAGPQLPAV